MSTIKTETLSTPSNSTVPVDTVVNGTAKAWVNFNGTGAVAIRRAFNVASITDNGTGNYTVNFTTAMADADYSAICNSSSGGVTNTDTMVNPYVWNVNSVSLGTNNNAGTIADRIYINVTIFS